MLVTSFIVLIQIMLRCGATTVVLPRHLRKLGSRIFESEEVLNNIMDLITDPEVVSVAGQNITLVQMKGDSSIKKIKEEFTDNVYRMKSMSMENGMVIDIGANIGTVSIYAAMLYPTVTIISVEPAPTTYFMFRINLHLNGIHVPAAQVASKHLHWERGVYPLLAAVSADDDPGTITVQYSDKESQFAVVGAKKDLEGWKKYAVQQVNINDYLSSATVSRPVHLLKIDCEGCEFWLLSHIHENFLDKKLVRHVEGEFHLSVMDPDAPHGPDTISEALATSTKAKLAKRGCPTDTWIFDC